MQDLSKVDISNDFRDFAQLYKSPEDIEEFIKVRNISAQLPCLMNILELRKTGKIEVTPTELKFYFDSMFDYIYDVYRVPVEETYVQMERWLEYIEKELVYNGFRWAIAHAFDNLRSRYMTAVRLNKFFDETPTPRNPCPVINYYKKIECSDEDYYKCKTPGLIEEFWIKSDQWSGQPVTVGDESYMRVWVRPTNVYIFGCDDMSYTLTGTREEMEEFSDYLKKASPVWNFSYTRLIHPKLEFTN